MRNILAVQHWAEFQAWIADIVNDHPDCDVTETFDGCAVTDENGDIVTEYDYESDAQRVRY